jgi:hypothetical protein
MSNTSQDQRPATASFGGGNTIVYVEYTPSGFQWGTDSGNLGPLATTIIVPSSTSITFEFLRVGSTAIWYKLPPSTPNGTVMPTSSPGPTVLVAPNNRASIAVSTSSGGPYYTGYVKVSDDGLDGFLVSGDNAGGNGGGHGGGNGGGPGGGNDEDEDEDDD